MNEGASAAGEPFLFSLGRSGWYRSYDPEAARPGCRAREAGPTPGARGMGRGFFAGSPPDAIAVTPANTREAVARHLRVPIGLDR